MTEIIQKFLFASFLFYIIIMGFKVKSMNLNKGAAVRGGCVGLNFKCWRARLKL